MTSIAWERLKGTNIQAAVQVQVQMSDGDGDDDEAGERENVCRRFRRELLLLGNGSESFFPRPLSYSFIRRSDLPSSSDQWPSPLTPLLVSIHAGI
jgi:hypothetical protein